MKKKILFLLFIPLAMIFSACGALGTSVVNTQVPTALIPLTGATSIPYGNGASPTNAHPLGGTPNSNTPVGPAVVDASNNPQQGEILVDSKGMTLYLFTKDTQNSSSSTCVGNCASVWLPFLTLGKPTSGTGVNNSLIGTITRVDGSTQVTYNGWPLYYFKNDKAAGDVNGEGVQGVWFLVTPDGNKK